MRLDPAIETPGLAWEPLEQSQSQDLITLISEMERIDNPPYRTTPDEVTQIFETEFQGLSGWDSDGRLQAYAIVRVVKTNGLQAVCSGGVGVNWRNRGVGSAIFEWEVATAKEMLQGRGEYAQIVCFVDQSGANLSDWMRTFGFEKTQSFLELRRDLKEAVEVVEPGQYLQVIQWSPELDDQVRRAHNRLIELTVGAPAQDAQAWQENRTFFAPQWSFVALDRSTDRAEVAGYLLSARFEADWEALGWSEGYTEMLGILPQYADTDVAHALLSRAIAAYQTDGMDYATVGLAEANPTDVASLYEEFGYRETGASTMWVMDVGKRETPEEETGEIPRA